MDFGSCTLWTSIGNLNAFTVLDSFLLTEAHSIEVEQKSNEEKRL